MHAANKPGNHAHFIFHRDQKQKKSQHTYAHPIPQRFGCSRPLTARKQEASSYTITERDRRIMDAGKAITRMQLLLIIIICTCIAYNG